MKHDLPLEDPLVRHTLMQDALLASEALTKAQAAHRQAELGATLSHALVAWQAAPVPGLRARAGWLACFSHFRLGQFELLLALGPQVLPLLNDPAVRAGLHRWLCVAATECAMLETARRHGAEAAALIGPEAEGDERIRLALAQAQAQLRGGDAAGAEARLVDALAQAEAQPQAWPLVATLLALVEATLDRWHGEALVAAGHARTAGGALDPMATTRAAGQAMDPVATARPAGEALERAVDHALRGRAITARLGDSHYHALLEGGLGEALLHQGQARAAQPHLERALCEALAQGLAAPALRLETTLAEAAWALGDGAAAQQRLDPVLAELGLRPRSGSGDAPFATPTPAPRRSGVGPALPQGEPARASRSAAAARAPAGPAATRRPAPATPVTHWRAARLALRIAQVQGPAAWREVMAAQEASLAEALRVTRGPDLEAA